MRFHGGMALANSKQSKGNDVSAVIQFLETLGRNPMLATGDNYERAVAALEVDQAHQAALVARDPEALIGLLNCRESMICMVWAPDQEPLKKDDDQEEQQIPLEEEPPAEQ
jgi:hypothetical protein